MTIVQYVRLFFLAQVIGWLMCSMSVQLSYGQPVSVQPPQDGPASLSQLLSDANTARLEEDYQASIGLLDSALHVAARMQNDDLIADVLTEKGVVCMYQSRYTEALVLFQRALRIRQQKHDTVNLAKSYNYIAAVHHLQQNFATAAAYYGQCLSLTDTTEQDRGLGVLYNNLGALNEELNNFPLALEYHQKSMLIWKTRGDSSWISVSLRHIGYCYSKQGQIDRALEAFQESYAIGQQAGIRINAITVGQSIGMLHLQTAQWNEALKWCGQSYDLAVEGDHLMGIQESAACLAQAYEHLHRPAEALRYYKLASQLRDSVFGQEKANELTRLELNFQFERQLLEDSLQHVNTSLVQQRKISEQRIGLVSTGIFASMLLVLATAIFRGKRRSDHLLLNILPASVAKELKTRGKAKAQRFDNVTVLFTDFEEFTSVSEKVSPEELVAEIHACFSAFDKIVEQYDVEKIKTIGDAYMAASGMPIARSTHAEDMVKAALDMQQFIRDRAAQRKAQGLFAFEMRVGIHSGTVIAGIVGTKKFQYDIWGDTVNVSARMESAGVPGKVNISETTYQLVKHRFYCEPRGNIEVKGKGMMAMYLVEAELA